MERNDIRELLNFIEPSACSYQEWVNVGMALKHEGCSVSDWEDWSRRDGRRYHSGECERKWRSFQESTSDIVTGGTLFQMAVNGGYVPEQGRELSWDDEITAPGIITSPEWTEGCEITEPVSWHPGKEVTRYIETLFDLGEIIGYAMKSRLDEERQKYIPKDKGTYKLTAGEILEKVSKHGDDIGASLGDYDPRAGAWIRFNPLDGEGVRNSNVTEYRYALVESDNLDIEKQNSIIRELELPVAVLMFSGGKSVHAIVRIDAADYKEYQKRVEYLYKICEKNGLKVDTQNKNPSRLSRLPGCMRGDKKQFIIDTNIGKSTWNEWQEWIEAADDNLPDVEDLADVWNDMPELAPALIDGILRQGHKMLIAGPSKAGKSFLQIELCIAMLYGTIEDLVDNGIEPVDMEPVVIRKRPDGMTGKIRDIALLCITHQLLGHAAKLMLDPLIQARLLPTQHASIPGHGQTRLKNQMHRYFLQESLGVAYIRKTDVVHAYASLQYDVCIKLIKEEIPTAKYAIGILKYLGSMAPDGHLIIGGYLDAWLFNFAMSYAVRYLYSLGTVRRGKKIPYVIRCGTFMDDFGIASASIKGEQRAVRDLDKWMGKNLNLQIKKTTGIIKLLSVEEEKRRRNLPRPAQRATPSLDMAGFRIGRTHVTIRRRIFKRARRQLIRGYKELQATGTLRRKRAQKITSYNGYIEQSDSYKLIEKYHVKELRRAVHKVNAFYGRLENKRKEEELHVLQERRRRAETGQGLNRESSWRDNSCPDGGQYRRICPGGDGRPEDVPF